MMHSKQQPRTAMQEQVPSKETAPVEEWVRAARVYAADRVSWFAPALYAAPLHLTEALPAPAGVDRHGRVYFNPRWVVLLYEACGHNPQHLLQQLAHLWYHEVAHWLREHSARGEELRAHPELWNIAADLELNDYLPEGMMYPTVEGKPLAMLPSDYHLPEGQIAEWYYHRLLQQAQQNSQSTQGRQSSSGAGNRSSHSQRQPQSGSGKKQPQRGSGRQDPQSSEQQQPQGSGSETPQQDSHDGHRDEGSGVHGQPRPWELPADAPETHALNDFDRKALQEEVARRITEHQKSRGTVPAGWLRWAEEVLKPKVNWRERLRRILRGVISEGLGQRLDYSYHRPNRRAAVYHPIYLPSLSQGEYKPRIACVVDTSGSISDQELIQALAEVRGILTQLRIPVTIIPCDAVPYEAIRVFEDSDWLQVRRGLRGGGGTDMIAGLNAALALKPKPEAVIVLTDGYTPFPSHRPKDTAVIWAIWQFEGDSPPLPPMPPWRPRDVVVIPIG